MHIATGVRKNIYIGLFFVTLATLMYEILLTRIFSVTMWYHFAFMAVSIALFGMTVGAIIVYLFPQLFTQERANFHLGVSALLFSFFTVGSFLAHLQLPLFVPSEPLLGLISLALTYALISIPFVFSGISVSIALTKFPKKVSGLYAADLGGAALGCLLLILTLRMTDGPTAIIVVALLASLGAFFFLVGNGRNLFIYLAATSVVCFGLLITAQTASARQGNAWLRLRWVKGEIEEPPLVERWNTFSRVVAVGDPTKPERPYGFGISSIYPDDYRIPQIHLNIDASADTILTSFDGDLQRVDYLKYDVTYLAHHLRPNSEVLVVGAGGGRDILAALVFDQESVLGVDLNSDIINIVNETFGDFTGHLDQLPGVQFIVEEARSFLAAVPDQFDIIQISLIDTWASTAAGAFVLSEHSLYTMEAWENFLQHLNSDGILTVSRWYTPNHQNEIYRLTALATAALREKGVERPRDHIVLLRNLTREEAGEKIGIGTILISRSPFTGEDLETLQSLATAMGFEIIVFPTMTSDPVLEKIANQEDLNSIEEDLSINLTPPTDNNPFFFFMLRLQDIFQSGIWDQGMSSSNTVAVYILGVLLVTVIILTFLCIIVPLLLTTKRVKVRDHMPLFLFFSGIGLGFMLIEISQMQRLIVFLGHPTYSLSVVLFTLLLTSGIGSFLTRRIPEGRLTQAAMHRLITLLLLLAVFGLATPWVIREFQAARTTIRILIAVGILAPIGLLMGMAFPIGMKIANRYSSEITPWLWGINGALSVLASVLAIAIALSAGIAATFWSGFVSYVLALLAIGWLRIKQVGFNN